MEDLEAAEILNSLAANGDADAAARLRSPDAVRALFLAGFDGGTTVEALAVVHERTRAGIEARAG